MGGALAVVIGLGFTNMPFTLAVACNRSENGTYFCSFSRKSGMSQAGRRAGGQRGESCGVQGCYKEVNPCSGSPATIKNLKVLLVLVQMVYPLLHFPL